MIITQLLSLTLPYLNITVNQLVDGPPVIGNCFPENNGDCNLRSAWSSCIKYLNPEYNTEYNNENCTINLPDNNILLFESSNYENLIFDDASYSTKIIIQGNNATIIGSAGGYIEGNFIYFSREAGNKFDHEIVLNNFQLKNFGEFDTPKGGAIYLSGITSAVFSGITFDSNRAVDAGSIYLEQGGDLFSSSIVIDNCHFISNEVYGKEGSGDGEGSGDDEVPEKVPGKGAAVFLHAFSNGGVNISNSYFLHGIADQGAGVYFDMNNDKINFSNCKFFSNIAKDYGGAVFFNTSNIKITFKSCILFNNTANSGGAMLMGGGNHEISFLNTSFIKNNALGDGGALYL